MSTPLGIGLSVDFAQLDAELSKVADRIEGVGKDVALRVGSLSGLAGGGGGLDTDQLRSQVAGLGIEMSRGLAGGIRTSSALMLSFGARINSMLDRLTGTAITMFNRIDSAMKFPMWDAFMSRANAKLENFWKTGKGGMSALDVAAKGGFGKIAQSAALILMPLFDRLGDRIGEKISESVEKIIPIVRATATTISKSMDDAAKSMSSSMGKAIDGLSGKFRGMGMVVRSTEADARALMGTYQDMGKYQKYPKFPEPAEPPLTEKRLFESVGKRPHAQEVALEPPRERPEFKGFRAVPQMLKILMADLAKIPKLVETAFASFDDSKAGLALGVLVGTIHGMSKAILNLGNGVARFFAFLANGVLNVVQKGMGLLNFFSSLGSIHKQTYSSMFRDHGLFVGSLLATIKTVEHLGRGLWDLATLRAFRRVGDDAGRARTSIGAATAAVGTMTKSVFRLGVEIAAAFGLIGVVFKFVDYMKGGVKAASDLNETTSRSKVVFQASFGAVEQNSAALERSARVSKNASLEIASGFGAMAIGAGFSEKQAASLSNQLTQMAADLSSSVNIPFSEAADKIKSALAGESEPLRQYGANIQDAAVNAQVAKITMGKLAGSIFDTGAATESASGKFARMRARMEAARARKMPPLPGGKADILPRDATAEQLKMAGRAQAIMKGLGYAQGDLARTSGEAANQFRKAGGGIALFAEKMGEMLLPAINVATTAFNALLGSVLNLVDRSSGQIKSWSDSISTTVGTMIENLGKFGPSIVENLAWAWEEAKKGPLSFATKGAEWVFAFVKSIPEMIGVGVRNMGTLWEIATLHVGQFAENAGRWFEVLPQNAGRVFDWLGKNWYDLLIDMGSALRTVGGNMVANATIVFRAINDAMHGRDWSLAWTPLLDGFKSTVDALPDMIKPALMDITKNIGDLWGKIERKELRLKLNAGVGVGTVLAEPGGPKGPGATPAADAASKDYKLASAVEVGSKEAYSIVAKSLAGGQGGPQAVAKEGVRVAKDSNVELKEINRKLGMPKPPWEKFKVK